MTRGTKRGHGGSQSKEKYDGSKRGYQPWKVKVNLRCLENLVWEKTFEGTEISLEGVAAGGLEKWAKEWVRWDYRMARDQDKFCDHDLLSGLPICPCPRTVLAQECRSSFTHSTVRFYGEAQR